MSKVNWETISADELMSTILEMIKSHGYPDAGLFSMSMSMYWKLRQMRDTCGGYIFGHGVLQIFGYSTFAYDAGDEYHLDFKEEARAGYPKRNYW